jgi:TPR repeat protein
MYVRLLLWFWGEKCWRSLTPGAVPRQGNMDTKQDQQRAVSLYRWANDLGHAQAALVLGAIHYNGVLGERDLEKAFE